MLVKVAVALILILAVAFGGIIYSDYLGQTARAESVSMEIQNDKNAGKIISKEIQIINSDIAEIDGKIEKLRDEIEREKDFLPEIVDSNKILRDIIILGEKCYVSIIPISVQEWYEAQIEGYNYRVLKVNLEITGRQGDVQEFISRTQNTDYHTLTINCVMLRRPSDPLDTNIIADMKLAVYVR
ncbi:MAG: hypothetical protein JXA46_15225 [Dehalococcoidales bacterium]|nr:hypothetical protein [Dehalococcoidales bacterium]